MKRKYNQPQIRTVRPAFSLIEILVVMGIFVSLLLLAIPTLQTVTMGSSLTRGGHLLVDQLALARQEAVGHNREVQVRLIQVDTTGYNAIQLWAPTPADVTVYQPIGRVVSLPEGTLISSHATLSPLLSHSSIPETIEEIPGRGSVKYLGFRFLPTGGTDLDYNSVDNFVMLVNSRDAKATTLPANYFAVQVDPVNGRSRIFRP